MYYNTYATKLMHGVNATAYGINATMWGYQGHGIIAMVWFLIFLTTLNMWRKA